MPIDSALRSYSIDHKFLFFTSYVSGLSNFSVNFPFKISEANLPPFENRIGEQLYEKKSHFKEFHLVYQTF